jgi:hypothetical protein
MLSQMIRFFLHPVPIHPRTQIYQKMDNARLHFRDCVQLNRQGKRIFVHWQARGKQPLFP